MARYGNNNAPKRIINGTEGSADENGLPLTISNLDEYFAILKKNIQDRTKDEQKSVEAVEKHRRSVRDKQLDEIQEREKGHIKELAKMQEKLSREGLQLTQEMQERFAEMQREKDIAADKKKLTEYYKNLSAKEKQRAKDDRARQERELAIAQQQANLGVIGKGGSVKDGFSFIGNQISSGMKSALDSSGMSKLGTEKLTQAINDLSSGINSAMEKYANYHATIDTRLQGSYYNVGVVGSSFDKLVSNLGIVSNSGLLSTESLYQNLSDLVESGVVTNLEQRAFYMTIKDTVATTFDANSKALNRIIRLQQDDSTAIRLGMESYLTRFLNEFVESTEYLTSTFDDVADALLEASSLMGSGASAEFEYTVQKWLGSLTGLGLSSGTATNIATAIGELASGNISSLSSSDMQNLIVMAASKSGLSYADMLTNGVTSQQANDLLLGVVEYLQELSSYSSNVVKSELARTFGVSVSDLVAAQNMSSEDLSTAYNSMMSSSDMAKELVYQLSQTGNRLGTAKILSNLYSNTEYSTGMSIAKNPALYALWKITDFISSATSQEGVAIPSFSVMGNQVDLETTVDALLKGGIAGVGMLSNIGGIISGLTSSLTGSGNVLLASLEASTLLGNAVGKLASGTGYNTNFYSSGGKTVRTSGTSTSSASYVGNYSGDDYADSAVNSAQDEADQTLDQKQAEEEDPILTYLKDMEFADKMGQISEDIHSIKDDGVKVSNMPNYMYGTELTGWYLGSSEV